MQIKLKNVFYKKLSNITLEIEHNKITGIIGNISSGKTDLCLLLSMYANPENGTVKFDNACKISLVADLLIDDMLLGKVENFIKEKCIKFNYKLSNIDKRVEDIIKMVGLDNSILIKDLSKISRTEKIRVLLAQNLLYNPDVIILDNIIEELDFKERTKLFKLFIKLKKFYNKTIIITSNNVDIIYEFIDNLIILDNGLLIGSEDKFTIYNNEEILNNIFIDKPITIWFKKILKEKKKIELGNNDSINELIKDIYREIR